MTQLCAYRYHISLIKFREWSRRNEKCFVGGKKSAFLVWGPKRDSAHHVFASSELRPQIKQLHKALGMSMVWIG